MCAEGDQQHYFPEIFAAEVFDDDFVGRVYGALCGPTQMNQVFGIGLFPRAHPVREKEWYKAMQDVQPGYEGPYLAEGPFQGLALPRPHDPVRGPEPQPAERVRRHSEDAADRRLRERQPVARLEVLQPVHA